MGISEDVRASLRDKLLNQIDSENLVSSIKILRSNDLMSYLAIREDSRSTAFVAVLLMVIGVLTSVFSLQYVGHALCVFSLSLVTPLAASVTFYQNMLVNWKLKCVPSTTEPTSLKIELFTLVAAIGVLLALGGQESVTMSMMPVFGALCVGSSLGLFKKMAQADKRVGPKFVTTFIFYASFALVVLTPYLKYPSLAQQLRQLENESSDPADSYFNGGDRAKNLAMVLFVGFLATFAAFAVCNALQHPDVKLGQISSILVLTPSLLYAVVYSKAMAAQLSSASIIAIFVVIAFIVTMNFLKNSNSKRQQRQGSMADS